MNDQLINELILTQQCTLPSKYRTWMEEFQEIPQRVMKPMSKMNRKISRLVRGRAKMLMLLDVRVSKFFKK